MNTYLVLIKSILINLLSISDNFLLHLFAKTLHIKEGLGSRDRLLLWGHVLLSNFTFSPFNIYRF